MAHSHAFFTPAAHPAPLPAFTCCTIISVLPALSPAMTQPTNHTSQLYIGLMSGTSLDGIDAALLDFGVEPPRIVATAFNAYPQTLVDLLLQLHHDQAGELHQSQQIANQLARLYAAAVAQLLVTANIRPAEVAAIGNHGQTIRHRPEHGYTLQLGNNALLAELSGIDVIGDFRSRDIAAGGQGAPLVPAFHRAIFGSDRHNRVILNIGGIANITHLPASGAVSGFDTGPGNLLLDSWIRLHRQQAYDRGGAWAASGTPIRALLAQLLAEPYLRQAPPKSTGRDLFNLSWLQRQLDPEWRAEDVQATLLAYTCTSITNAVADYCAGCEQIYVCGGGAHNTALMQALQQQLPGIDLATTGALGIDPDWVEASAFAWLAHRFVQRQPGNLPAVTGASGLRVLGALYPH